MDRLGFRFSVWVLVALLLMVVVLIIFSLWVSARHPV
jgi:hypothetical protein